MFKKGQLVCLTPLSVQSTQNTLSSWADTSYRGALQLEDSTRNMCGLILFTRLLKKQNWSHKRVKNKRETQSIGDKMSNYHPGQHRDVWNYKDTSKHVASLGVLKEFVSGNSELLSSQTFWCPTVWPGCQANQRPTGARVKVPTSQQWPSQCGRSETAAPGTRLERRGGIYFHDEKKKVEHLRQWPSVQRQHQTFGASRSRWYLWCEGPTVWCVCQCCLMPAVDTVVSKKCS